MFSRQAQSSRWLKVHLINVTPAMKTNTRSRWMVVDDDPGYLWLLQQILAAISDAEICCFQSGLEALCAFESDPCGFELIITDFNMPEIRGDELCRQFRLRAPGLKIVLTTGSSDWTECDALQNGFDAFLAKPFSVANVRAVAESLLRSQSSFEMA